MSITKTGVELISIERQRQIEKEERSAQLDDMHLRGELAGAAACYALVAAGFRAPTRIEAYRNGITHKVRLWPWVESYWKPSDPIRNLEKAGALIAAEIDRLQRKSNGRKPVSTTLAG